MSVFFHLNASHVFGETNDSSEPQMRGRDFSGVQLSAMDTAPLHIGEGGGGGVCMDTLEINMVGHAL